MKRILAFIIAIVYILPVYSLAATINVPGDQPNIQSGIDAAVDGDTVLLADGIYSGAGNYNINFSGKAITVASVNGPGNCIVDCQQQGQGFWFYNGETETSVLDGLTIRNGYATGDGGGVAASGSPTISNCTFTGNSASRSGGAVSSRSSSFTNCTFTGNSATDGGAVSSRSSSFVNCTFTGNSASRSGGAVCSPSSSFTNCTFTGNSATKFGGAVWTTYSSSSPSSSFTNCTFTDNSATNGGAVYTYSSSSHDPPFSSFTNCIFTGNRASECGGAVHCYFSSFTNCVFTNNNASESGGAVYLHCSCSSSFTNCTFTGNSATDGGAVYTPYSPSFINCTFTGNRASESGGAVYSTSSFTDCTFTSNSATNGGAVYFYSSNSSSFINCVFTNNNASESGGAVYSAAFHYSSYFFTNCIFTGNSATDGGAVYVTPSSYFSLTNCTFAFNEAACQGGALWCNLLSTSEDLIIVKNCIIWGNTAPEGKQIYEEGKPLLMSYSDIQGGYFGSANINIDPMFVDAAHGDVHILFGSPCIDTGTADGAPVDDLDGSFRPKGNDYDIGAYEGGCSLPVTAGVLLPTNQSAWNYPLVVNPVIESNPANCQPFAVGDLSTGNLSLQIGLPEFSSGVDVYLAIGFADALYLVDGASELQPAAGLTTLPKWKTNNSAAIDESLYGDIPISLLPAGMYNLYTLVVPTGETNFSHYYLWATSFNINH